MITVELVAAISAGIVSILTAVGAVITIARTKKAIEIDAVKKDAKLECVQSLVDTRLSEALSEIIQLKAQILKSTRKIDAQIKDIPKRNT